MNEFVFVTINIKRDYFLCKINKEGICRDRCTNRPDGRAALPSQGIAGKEVLEFCAVGVGMTLLQKGTAFSVSKGIAYWKDLN